MLDVAACPCCGASALRQIGATRYGRSDPPPPADAGARWSHGAQRELVFGEWLPGREEVLLRELLCERCGAITGSPRPSARDIARKYELLARHGGSLGHGAAGTPSERERARRVRDALAGHLRAAAPRILDVGGGDGSLLTALEELDDARCFVVDFETEQVPGVVRLGATLDDLPGGARFDAIVLSHVLEHVADPGALLAAARERAPLLYAEVPVEVWRGTPVGRDPVTHVNHLTGASLEALLRSHGWRPLRVREQFARYRGHPLEVAWAVAEPGPPGPPPSGAARAVLRRLEPSVRARLARRLRWRRFLAGLPAR